MNYVGERLMGSVQLTQTVEQLERELANRPLAVCAVSAPDIGVNMQVLALRTGPGKHLVAVNPTVTAMPLEGTRTVSERLDACGPTAGSRQIVRSKRVTLSFSHPNGTRDTVVVDNSHAYCAQTYVEMFTVGMECV